jgi:hypothetical protein
MTASALTVQEVTVTYGRTKTYIADPDQFRIDLQDFSGGMLARIQTYDPRGIRVYLPSESGAIRDSYTLRAEADGVFIIPFVPRLNSLQFGDAQGHSFGSVQVASAIKGFCADKRSDRECVQWVTDLEAPPASSPGEIFRPSR